MVLLAWICFNCACLAASLCCSLFLYTSLVEFSHEAHLVQPAALKGVDTFLEELIVRRELADNFCFYQPHYDSLQGAWEWARKTLMDHASDKREHTYT